MPLAFVALAIAGCGVDDRAAEVKSALQDLTAGKSPFPVPVTVWKDVKALYARRDFAPIWIERGKTTAADAALQVLQRAREHGLEPGDYGADDIARRLDPDAVKRAYTHETTDGPRQTGELDVRLTTALLSLGHDVALGRTRPETIDRQWKAQRTAPDLVATLLTARERDLSSWLDAVAPHHHEYTALRQELARLRREPDEGDPAIDDRIARVRVNLDRWRWMPDDLGARYVWVDIPAFELTVRENGTDVLGMKVVVGKPDRKTPVFSAAMSTVVFSPYWNVPDSIAEGETAPAAARDSGYLERNGIEILRTSRSGATPVDPSSVDWNDAAEVKRLAFRQKPGAKNALGHVKFLFPNPFDVYLHDTPSVRLFARPRRALSHGCVRLEKPEALAQWVLSDSSDWDEDRISRAMQSGVEKHVKLKAPIPVHIVYFTTWIDASGDAHYEPDVYGYDAKQSVSLAAANRTGQPSHTKSAKPDR
jgi:murein L,D-transpeptidase YcbB/YkuD